MANLSKLIFGVAIAAATIATPAWLPTRASQFLLMGMSHEVTPATTATSTCGTRPITAINEIAAFRDAYTGCLEIEKEAA
jgi:hypothetical protein